MAELYLYEVPHRNFTTTMKLSEDDAEMIYGDLAKKVRPVPVAQPQPVPTPPWAVDPDAPADDSADSDGEKKAPAARNKSRTTSSKG